jgi:transposase
VQRAKIILMNHNGMRDKDIKDALKIDTNTVRLCLNKCLTLGVEAALNDIARPGAPVTIKQEEKAWIIYIACEKPKTFGYAQETWSLQLLLEYIHEHAQEKGFDNLKKTGKIQTLEYP